MSITVTDSVTGTVITTASSDNQGRFELLELPPGIYDVTASLEEFVTVSQPVVGVTSWEPVAVDFRLGVSGLYEDVDVQGESGPPDILDTPMLAETLEGELLDIVPVRGDDFDTLLPPLPGVERTPRGVSASKEEHWSRIYTLSYFVLTT